MAKTGTKSDAFLRDIRAFGLSYPGTSLKSPWPDHCDLAVKDKTFAYLSTEGQPFGISCKLPQSNAVALMLPNAEPTGYGLGKSGWVTVQYAAGEVPPIELIEAWIDESYRAQAPKKLIAALDGGAVTKPQANKTKAQPRTKPKTKAKTAKSKSKRR